MKIMHGEIMSATGVIMSFAFAKYSRSIFSLYLILLDTFDFLLSGKINQDDLPLPRCSFLPEVSSLSTVLSTSTKLAMTTKGREPILLQRKHFF